MMANLLGWVIAAPFLVIMALGRATPFVIAAIVVSFIVGAVIF